MSAELSFWEECISDGASECGVKLTPEQLTCIAESAKSGHENYGMAFYQPESPYPSAIKKLEKQLEVERNKVVCRECNGHGDITTYGPHHSATSQCWKCHGEGKVSR